MSAAASATSLKDVWERMRHILAAKRLHGVCSSCLMRLPFPPVLSSAPHHTFSSLSALFCSSDFLPTVPVIISHFLSLSLSLFPIFLGSLLICIFSLTPHPSLLLLSLQSSAWGFSLLLLFAITPFFLPTPLSLPLSSSAPLKDIRPLQSTSEEAAVVLLNICTIFDLPPANVLMWCSLMSGGTVFVCPPHAVCTPQPLIQERWVCWGCGGAQSVRLAPFMSTIRWHNKGLPAPRFSWPLCVHENCGTAT